jgi:hypothetical protein
MTACPSTKQQCHQITHIYLRITAIRTFLFQLELSVPFFLVTDVDGTIGTLLALLGVVIFVSTCIKINITHTDVDFL